MSLRTQAFAERFKYGVISSSLLSPAFSTTPIAEPHRRTLSPSLPGKLFDSHSRTPSAAESMMTDNLSLSMPPEPETPLWPFTVSFTVAVVAFSARFYFCALLLLAAALYYMHVHRLDGHSKVDVMTPSLLALQHLTAAGHVWDTVINDSFTLLENAEQSVFYSPASPLTPSSSLRVALSTSLLTTQTQCDNVRQFLSAITSPSELAQLAEMYAPPSPIKPTFARSNNSHRPLSHPGSPPHATPATDRMKKRSTWNGSYTSLALAGTSSALATRRGKRRSDLSALLGSTSPTPARTRSRNALSSPPQLLADVSEEEGMVTAESSLDEEEHSFGAAALGLYRSRVCEGLRALELSHRRTPSSLSCGSSTRHRTTMSPGSRYTSMHTTRHPFSLSSLRQSLQNALASKRFACSHLLALRFEDDEDDVYWEDVRSVVSLLTSTLVDASSRLSEVLDEVEEQRLKMDDTPSESASGLQTPSSLASPPPSRTRLPLSQAIEQLWTDAREQLRQCVAFLKEDQTLHSPGHSSHPSSSSCGDVPPSGVSAAVNVSAGTFGEPSEHPAIQAYERLRRELGLALRECERGRERLVHIVVPPTPSTEEDFFADDPDDVKDASQPPLPPSSRDDDVHLTVLSPSGEPVQLEPERDPESEPGLGVNSDDATAHLLFAASAAHLPPSGIEQVFETDSGGVGTFMRERSKMSREERIQLARAKRERGERVSRPGHDPIHDADAAPHGPADDDADASSPRRERWGPSGDVVQELKDVIWKVGERRRKMTESQMLLGTVISGLENPSVSRVDMDIS
ncbi:hypothetical protein JVT61DRAFT_417 [Boletus reticuloceps]|uniref:Uncharacterized protein n=1 Tax=Boletus reticuloceps TaxID=495285 RepID=A0A8I2Z2V5_9AGAM|nr:hypothetical protein JVT61DRAFT_417 [Boletus reticuloceps]